MIAHVTSFLRASAIALVVAALALSSGATPAAKAPPNSDQQSAAARAALGLPAAGKPAASEEPAPVRTGGPNANGGSAADKPAPVEQVLTQVEEKVEEATLEKAEDPVEETVEEAAEEIAQDEAPPPRTLRMVDKPVPDFVAGEVLFFSKADRPSLNAIAAANAVSIVRVAPLDRLGVTMVTARLASGDNVPAAIARLEASGAVAWAQPNHIFQLLGNSRSRGLAMHGLAPEAWPNVTGTIAMIDSVVETTNPSFAGAAVEQHYFGVGPAPGAHGTAIAEILVGTGDFPGVARGARLVSLAAFPSAGAGESLSQTDRLALAFERTLALDPDALNLSFGAERHDRALAAYLEKLEKQGVCVSAAAGNLRGGSVRFPARLATVLAVTAVSGSRQLYADASTGMEVDIAAWGVEMSAAVPGGRSVVSGTSFATAILTGAMLHMPACKGAANPQAMREAIALDALDLGATGRDRQFGAGLFRLGEAGLSVPPAQSVAASAAPSRASILLIATVLVAGLLFLLLVLLLRGRKRQAETRS